VRYPGGKGQAGIYQRLISLMPPHDVYIEPFVGGGNLLTRKRPASSSIAIDADADVAGYWRGIAAAGDDRSLTVIHGDAAAFLRALDYAGRRVLIYADPPYVMATRKSQRAIYRHEFTDQQHHELLTVLRAVPALVMLSGYRCPMYDAALSRWRSIDYPTLTRGGSWAIETLWLNFDPPAQLHDFRYIGTDFRERERIKRKRARWRRRFAALPGLEREAMLQVLLDLASPGAAVRSSSSEMALPDPAPGMAMGPALDPLVISGDAISPAGIVGAGDSGRPPSPGLSIVDDVMSALHPGGAWGAWSVSGLAGEGAR